MVVRPTRIPLVIRAQRAARMLLLSDKLTRCAAGTNFNLLRLNPLDQRKLPIVISLSRMLCFDRVCTSPCALNVSAPLQGAYTCECLGMRRRAFTLDGQVSAAWSRCPGSMARCARDSVAPLRRSSAGWMPARMGRLSAGLGRRHPVTVRKASLMVGSMRRV